MSLAVVTSRAGIGIDAPPVQVEAHLSNGLPAVQIVGLPETAVRESRDRVRSALINSGYSFPARRITINLAPADLPKEGGRYDLPIALALLCASDQLPRDAVNGSDFLGELALTGALRPVSGVLPAAVAAGREKRPLVVSHENASEAAQVSSAEVHAAGSLQDLCQYLAERTLPPRSAPAALTRAAGAGPDLAEVRGQHHARRALEIAATGGHNLLFFGPPGAGKTLLAERLPGLLPALNEKAALESACIHSVAGTPRSTDQWRLPPFRAPHHSASAIALAGGGSTPRPGEVSLAHRGVLFLDELPEFPRAALEILREPLECGEMRISRARGTACFPARFLLVGAMNPCPCGHGPMSDRCRCTPDQVRRYLARLSGPLLDRIDLHVQVAPVPVEELLRPGAVAESSATVRSRVAAARALLPRETPNAHDPVRRIHDTDRTWLAEAATSLGLSGRSLHRLARVAQSIAALAGEQHITRAHLLEAFSFRAPLPASAAAGRSPATILASTSPA